MLEVTRLSGGRSCLIPKFNLCLEHRNGRCQGAKGSGCVLTARSGPLSFQVQLGTR